MEPIDDLCLLIIRSIPSQAPLIQRQVAALLKQTIGVPHQRNRLNQDAKFSAGNLVKRLLTTIEERLKRKPEIDLFQTHAECRSYLKYLCEVTNSQESKYEYIERLCGFMHCYEHLLRYTDVQREGYAVLKDIHKSA
ncbi:hypothetical protein Tco_0143633 [Tanacetum coccineum]